MTLAAVFNHIAAQIPGQEEVGAQVHGDPVL